MDFGTGADNELRITNAITLWGRLQIGSDGAAIASRRRAGYFSPYWCFSLGYSLAYGGSAWWTVYTNGTTGVELWATNNVIPVGTWLDLAAVFSPASSPSTNDGVMALFKDGQLVTARTHNATAIYDSPLSTFVLGGSLRVTYEQFRVYNSALSAEEIRQLSHAPVLSIGQPCALSWFALKGASYQCLRTDDLIASTWSNLWNTIEGTDSTVVTNDLCLDPQRFYRVLMSWLKKLFGGGGTEARPESPKMDIDGMSFDQLMKTAEEGFLHGVDDATCVRCLRRAASIASQSNDMTKKLIVNSVILSFRERGLIQ